VLLEEPVELKETEEKGVEAIGEKDTTAESTEETAAENGMFLIYWFVCKLLKP
jgi:hypothetical protein